MKVKITEDSKKILTLAEMSSAKRIINESKNDGYTTEELAKQAMSLFCHFKNKELEASGYYPVYSGQFKIFNAVAEIAKNNRIYDWWGEDTGHLDVWISWIAVSEYYGAVELGMYVSDIHHIMCDYEVCDSIYYNMYINEYQPLKRNVNLG